VDRSAQSRLAPISGAIASAPVDGNADDDIDYFGPRPTWFGEAAVGTVLDESQLDPDVVPISPDASHTSD
jgi:hypothetical protein